MSTEPFRASERTWLAQAGQGRSRSPSRERSQRQSSRPQLRIRGTPAEFIGYVEAENVEQAIEEAIKQFEIRAKETGILWQGFV